MIAPKDNPFRAQRLDRVPYRLQRGTWAQLEARLARLRCRAAIVGPHGSGKTTMLDALQTRLATRGLHIVRADLRCDEAHPTRDDIDALTKPLSINDVLMYDGADHLSVWRWRQLRRATRHCGGLIVTSHARRLLPILARTHTTPSLLRELVSELLDGDARPDITSRCETLFAEHRGNLRDALRACYHLARSSRRQAAKR